MLLAILSPPLLHRHRSVQTEVTGLNINSKSNLKAWTDRTTDRPTGRLAGWQAGSQAGRHIKRASEKDG